MNRELKHFQNAHIELKSNVYGQWRSQDSTCGGALELR